MIEQKYLLVIMIPTYVDSEGGRRVDELWHKDLVKHLDHIADLALAAPARHEPTPGGRYLELEAVPARGSLSYVDMPSCRSTLEAIVGLPSATYRLWKEPADIDCIFERAIAHLIHAVLGGGSQ